MNEEMENKKLDKSLWKRIFKYLLVHKKILLGLFSILVILATTDAITPLFSRYAIDTYIATRNSDGIIWFAVIYLIVIVIKATTIFGLIYMAEKLFVLVSNDIRKDQFKKLQELSFSFYDQNTIGSLIARLTSDTWRLTGIISWGLVDLIWGSSIIIFVVIIMFTLNVKITLIVLTVIPVLALITIYFRKNILKATRKSRKDNSAITASFNEGIQGATTSKTLVREVKNLSEFNVKTNKLKSSSIRISILSALFYPIVASLGIVGTSLALWSGGILMLNSVITIGTLAAFITYSQQFFFPINDLARIIANFQMAQAAGERVFSLLDAKNTIVDSQKVLDMYGIVKPSDEVPKINGAIEFKNVSFQYKEGEKVLDNFSLKINPGECIAIVGETGSGKTTIVNLACRFYEPTSGEILIDGKNYKDVPLMYTQGNLGYMLQTPHLFSGSIIENIRYGNSNATDEEIIKISKMVKADEFIRKFKDGYDHKVSKGGGGLSTGQKQLICIARAIIANPSIFVLDEATSSVDTHTEQIIQHAISTVIAGRTSFVIAHRLSTIRQADRILVLEKGKVIEQGSHDQLISKKGHYYDLYTSQFIDEQEHTILD